MREEILQPQAAALSQSMRDLGYSLEAAIADLIDNSISAGATLVRIFPQTDDDENPVVAIADNGSGMTRAELFEAMRPGTKNPREQRNESDLGRFGMGLKTASFSQCRRLTVITRKNDSTEGACWDLDLISERNEWVVQLLSEDDIQAVPFIHELGKRGTLVVWQKMDRLAEGSPEQQRSALYSSFETVNKHISLVFHRYISGTYNRRAVKIETNGYEIEAFDPFFTSNKATQALHTEIIHLRGHKITIQPYILPHHSKLTMKERDYYSTRTDFVHDQGAYVYRNGRLMSWGHWFRLAPRNELTKLARVQIDFPNALDDLWTIDIKKSRADLPLQVRDTLRTILGRVSEASKRTYTDRGTRLLSIQEYPIWVRFNDRDMIRYGLNADHPVIESFRSMLPEDLARSFDMVLNLVEKAVPVESIHADFSHMPHAFEEKTEVTYEQLQEMIKPIQSVSVTSGSMDADSFLRMLLTTKPFSSFPKWTEMIVKDLAR